MSKINFFRAHDCTEYKDINGKVPEILLFDGNRSAGKTTAFIYKLINDFKKDGKIFMYIFRYRNELSDPSETIFKDVKGLFFPDDVMTHKSFCDGIAYDLMLNGEHCGYAVPLNLAFKLKRFSHYYSDTDQMFFDEYQTEDGYCPREIEKFQALHTSVARGNGQPVRFVPIYMCSNSLSIFNPYYELFGITGRIKSSTKVLRGDGFVLNRVVMHDVAKAQEQSAFMRACSGSKMFSSSVDNTFLNDDEFNVEKMDTSTMLPIFVFRYKGTLYTVYTTDRTFLYVRAGGDIGFYSRYGVTLKDRKDGFRPFRQSYTYDMCKNLYESASVYFSNLQSKEAFVQLLTV